MPRFAILVFAAVALTACGGKNELQPEAGKTMPPAPAGIAATPTPTQLMTPEIQARPRRSDEVLKQSDARRDDRFDLPPQ